MLHFTGLARSIVRHRNRPRFYLHSADYYTIDYLCSRLVETEQTAHSEYSRHNAKEYIDTP